MKPLLKISDLLDRICSVLIVFMIGAMVIITVAQIIFRTWFSALSWSEELTRYLLIWSTFLGATCVYRHSGNISITFIQSPTSHIPLLHQERFAQHGVCLLLPLGIPLLMRLQIYHQFQPLLQALSLTCL